MELQHLRQVPDQGLLRAVPPYALHPRDLDPTDVLARFALALAGGPAGALAVLVDDLDLTSAVLRADDGELLASAGAAPRPQPALELPVGGSRPATLAVVGADPALLGLLLAACAVLALGTPGPDVEQLLAGEDRAGHAVGDALHDGPVQDLVAARWAVDAAVRSGDATGARDAVQIALVALRRTIWHARPRGGAALVEDLQGLAARQLEAGLVPVEVRLEPGGDQLRGSGGVTAYRLVQAVTGTAPATVVLHAGRGRLLLAVDGAADLPDPDRWQSRVRALGGTLTCVPGRLLLSLPVPPAPGAVPAHTQNEVPA